MTATYFDRREGREKPIPNCGAVGLVWDEQTQRCERRAQLSMFPFDADMQQRRPGHQGLGIEFTGAIAAGSAGGPIGTVIGAIVGGLVTLFRSGIFGGGDDQATTYRPPSNAAQLCVSFNDARGAESVAYDMSQLGAAIANGNRDVDLYSYYSAFVSGRTDMGASQAAARVIQDAATRNGVSISRAADLILQVAGVPRLACAGGFLPGPGATSGSSGLPGYCPAGTYHPYPIGDPRQDVCEPFPESYLAAQIARQMEIQRQAQQQQQARGGTATGAQPGAATGATGAPAGMWLNPATGRYEPIPQCSQGSVFDPRVGQCVSASSGGLFDGDLFSGNNLWLWLLIAAGLIYATSGNGDEPRRARR